jgi:CRISPR-associated protein Csb2
MQVLDASRFWLPPAPGHLRRWRTEPAAVPDTRGAGRREWTFAHAALLSLGFAWKDFLPDVPGRGESYHRGLAAAASDWGAAVIHVRAVRAADVSCYVHKVNEHAVVRPYTACLSLGDPAGTGTLQAIGQSSHLGGGLLVPFDVPDGVPAGGVSLPGTGSHRSGA